MTRAEKGKVHLVGAGPGDPELLTVRALRLIQTADTILHDDLVPDAILALAPKTALTISVGKRCGVKKITQAQIHSMMIESAQKGLSVVRLKSGDPLIFGRAAEEMEALTSAGIPFEVVPGVTAAFAAAAALGISLTDRRAASGVQFSTAHHAEGSGGKTCVPTRSFDATQVIYMPGRSFAALAAEWLGGGASADLPCAVISRAAQPDQSVQQTTLGRLGKVVPAGSPTILLAGWALAPKLESAEEIAGLNLAGISEMLSSSVQET
jgi:uroporphyrin-III C-methyltransferase